MGQHMRIRLWHNIFYLSFLLLLLVLVMTACSGSSSSSSSSSSSLTNNKKYVIPPSSYSGYQNIAADAIAHEAILMQQELYGPKANTYSAWNPTLWPAVEYWAFNV